MKKSYNLFLACLLAQTAPAQRMMYVDGFNTILNSVSQQTALLQYAQNQQITHLYLYDMHLVHAEHDLTLPTTNQILADFIRNAKQNYGIAKIEAVAENAYFFQNRIMPYNSTRNTALEKFDGLVMEFEFWLPSLASNYYCDTYLRANGFTCDTAGAFQYCKEQLEQVLIMTTFSPHPMTLSMYVGWVNEGQLQSIAPLVDQTLLHAYVNDPNNAFAYAETRLQYYNHYSGVANVAILFSAEAAFMQNWLRQNSILAAEQIFTEDYQAAAGDWKNHVDWQGKFCYFNYSTLATVPLSKQLPLEITDFKLFTHKNKNNLYWKIQNPSFIQGFEIEKSLTGKDFEKVGWVTFNGDLEYHFEEPAGEYVYYRLKIMELDGKFSYSKIIATEKSTPQTLHIYPNPANDLLWYDLENIPPFTVYRILNVVGQVVATETLNASSIDIQSLTPGHYWLHIGNHAAPFIKK